MMKRNQEISIGTNDSALLLQQFLGRPRFASLIKDATEQIKGIESTAWSPERLADYVSNEIKNPC